MPGLSITLTHQLGKVNATFGADADVRVSQIFRKAMTQASEVLKEEVIRGYSGEGRAGWPALHWFTVAEKGHDKPLYHKGELMDHVVTVQDDKGVAVGFIDPEQARIATIHETGAIIRVTPRMRGFLAARGFRLKATTNFLVIPARGNFGRAIGEKLPEITKIITDAIDAYYRKRAI